MSIGIMVMRSKKEIKEEIERLESVLVACVDEGLNEKQLRVMRGKIKILEWVLSDQKTIIDFEPEAGTLII